MNQILILATVWVGLAYSYLISVVVGSAIIPTIIANLFFTPHHLLNTNKGEASLQEQKDITTKPIKLTENN